MERYLYEGRTFLWTFIVGHLRGSGRATRWTRTATTRSTPPRPKWSSSKNNQRRMRYSAWGFTSNAPGPMIAGQLPWSTTPQLQLTPSTFRLVTVLVPT